MNDFRIFYEMLEKPTFAPSPELFGFVWGILYPLIIIASAIMMVQIIRGKLPVWLSGVLFFHWICNLLFTPVELGMGLLAGSVVIIVALVTLLYLQVDSWYRSTLLFFLWLPYTGWVLFVTMLQISLLALN